MGRSRTFRFVAVAALLALGSAIQPPAVLAAGSSPLFRVILNDGRALVSFGEFARVGDRVVFSMPLDPPQNLRLQLVSLPASVVDWESTARYTEAARYAQYVATHAEADFALLTGEMAAALNTIALTHDPARRLAIAEQARRTLLAWPAEHFGYRSADVREMDALLEGTISDLRSAAGVRRFDFSLVATIEPPTMPLLPDPTPAQTIEQALAAARLSAVPAERVALLQAAIARIDENAGRLPKASARRTRATARTALEAELEVERRYGALAATAERKSGTAAARADVREVEHLIATTEAEDRTLGSQRQEQIAGLLALLHDRLDSARRLRLARDRWAGRVDALRAYRHAVTVPIGRFERLRGSLEDIKALAGPDVRWLPDLDQRFERVYRQLRILVPPDEMAAAHATLLSAVDLAQQAVRTRERAAASGDVPTAWDASSAAAGSLMLLAQARRQMDAALRPPELP